MATNVFNGQQLSGSHRRMFSYGTLILIGVLFICGLVFTSVYAPTLSVVTFWACIAWLCMLVFLVWGVFTIQLGSNVETRPSLSSKVNFKPGATMVASLYATVSAVLLVMMAETLTNNVSSVTFAIFIIIQTLLLCIFAAFLILRYTELIPGLPPQAADQAEANIASLQIRLDELEELRNSKWLEDAKGPTPKGRLKAAVTWWREELATSMPQSGLEMSQPFISYFLENVSRDTLFIRDLAINETEADSENVLEAEQRVIEGISRTGQIVRKMRGRPPVG